MFLIDSLSFRNKLNQIHPGEKLFLSGTVIVFSLGTHNFIIPLFLFFFMTLCVVAAARIPLRLYLKLLAIPFFFIIMGILPIIITFGADKAGALYYITVFNVDIGVTAANLSGGGLLALKSFGAIAGFYFFILTTPFSSLEYLLKKSRVPLFLREIILMTYRYIFVFINIFRQIREAQTLRGGYNTLRGSLGSIGKSVVILFRKALYLSRLSLTAMETRGYSGQINFFDPQKKYSISIKSWLFIFIFTSINCGLLIWAG